MNIILISLYAWIEAVVKSTYEIVKLSGFSVVLEADNPFSVNRTIESMNSQQFSVAIFYFLVATIVVFTIFVLMFMLKDRTSKLKTGEKWLFAWIMLGIVVAVIFGATQMLHGYLF